MIDFSAARLTALASTWVGNKGRYEGFKIPQRPVVPVNDSSEEMLMHSFLTAFKNTEDYYYLHGENGPIDNPQFTKFESIFFNPADIGLDAGKLTESLYLACENPKIQGGEFFVMYFEDLMVSGEPTSGIGLWKVDGHTPFFKTDRTAEANLISTTEGIATGKPQVAALILNLDSSEGYQICVLDTISKKGERSFWKDDFMRLRPIEDDYFQTMHWTSLTAEFIREKAPTQLSLPQVEVQGLLVKAGDYFKDINNFHQVDFAEHLFSDGEREAKFHLFVNEYSKAYAIPMSSEFTINLAAVKKQAKLFKAGFKLDKNFVVQAKSRLDLMEMGYDEGMGLKFLKIYFDYAE